MPFDGATFSGRGDPSPRRSGSGLLNTLKEMALSAAATLVALLIGGLAGALVDGPLDPSVLQAGSTMASIAGTGSFLVVIGAFVWWRVRRQMADL